MRVSVQLIEAETGAHLWAERFYLVRARWPTPERPHSLKREPPTASLAPAGAMPPESAQLERGAERSRYFKQRRLRP